MKEKKNYILIFASFILIFSILGQMWLPWWILMVVSALAGLLFMHNALLAFITAFVLIAGQWFVYAYWINSKNEFILANKIATLFQLDSSLLLILVASLLAGLAAAFSASSGALLRGLAQGK
jgi:hypothetical protein